MHTLAIVCRHFAEGEMHRIKQFLQSGGISLPARSSSKIKPDFLGNEDRSFKAPSRRQVYQARYDSASFVFLTPSNNFQQRSALHSFYLTWTITFKKH